jgi:hypothetical protein
MATLRELCQRRVLHMVDPQLSWREQQTRAVYATTEVMEWLVKELPNEVSNWNIDVFPEDQVAALIADFCAGKELHVVHQVRIIKHIDCGVWELKTADIRLFGWFHCRDVFVCTGVDSAWRIKEQRLYSQYRDNSVAIRNTLDLDEPKHVTGSDYDLVLSDWCYPPS